MTLIIKYINNQLYLLDNLKKMIISPCISICKTDPQTGYCYGCGRSNEEKKLWKIENTSNQWKNDNLTENSVTNWLAIRKF